MDKMKIKIVDNGKAGYVFSIGEVIQCWKKQSEDAGIPIDRPVMNALNNRNKLWKFYVMSVTKTFEPRQLRSNHRKYLNLKNITGFWYLIKKVSREPEFFNRIKTIDFGMSLTKVKPDWVYSLYNTLDMLNPEGYHQLRHERIAPPKSGKRIRFEGKVMSIIENITVSYSPDPDKCEQITR